jgi:hypothetical protein
VYVAQVIPQIDAEIAEKALSGWKLIYLDCLLTTTTTFGAAKELGAAMGASITIFFLFHPLFTPEGFSGRDGAKYYPFSERDRKIINCFTGKLIAFVAAFVILFPDTIPDTTCLAVNEVLFRQTASARNLLRGDAISTGKFFLQFLIIVATCHIHTANPAIETAWSG